MIVEEELRAYFASGASVCPYAKTAQITFFGDRVLSIPKWAAVLSECGVAVICARTFDQPRNFEQARRWCRQVMGFLHSTLGSVDVSRAFGADRTLPFVQFGPQTFYAIGMGPQYPVEHPRFAPHLCLVSVNEAEIRKVSEHDRAPIRRAMAARAGALYDADEVWLPVKIDAGGRP